MFLEARLKKMKLRGPIRSENQIVILGIIVEIVGNRFLHREEFFSSEWSLWMSMERALSVRFVPSPLGGEG
jgi:hypothetical protein